MATSLSSRLVVVLGAVPEFGVFSPAAAVTQQLSMDPITLHDRLGISHVVNGNLRTTGSIVTVVANLVAVETGEVIWSAVFDRTLEAGDMLAIQNEICDGIVTSLASGNLASPKEPPVALRD